MSVQITGDGLFTWSFLLLVFYYSPVVCTDMVYSLGRYLYWWSINPQLSVLTWFIHLNRQLGTNKLPVEVTTK
jgi:hypothetical protein